MKVMDKTDVSYVNGYQYSATGIFGHAFYIVGEKVCSVSGAVVPSPNIDIIGGDEQWRSEFDQESTIVPGLTRYVVGKETEEVVWRIVYREQGKYEVLFSKIEYDVQISCEKEYLFVHNGEVIATIKNVSEKTSEIPRDLEDYETESRFWVSVKNDIKHVVLMGILSFPMLRFGL